MRNNDNDSCSSGSSGSHMTSDDPTSIVSTPSQMRGETGSKDRGSAIAQEENDAVFKIRFTVMVFLIISTIGVACLVYFNTRSTEMTRFEEAFNGYAWKALESLGGNLEASVGAMDSFVVTIVSFANYTNMTWPFVTVPNYGTRASKVRFATKSVVIVEIPTVSLEEKDRWNQYSMEHGPLWVDQNIKVQNGDPTFQGMRVDNYTATGLWGVPPNATVIRPMWQSYPTVPLHGNSPFNLDLSSLPTLGLAVPYLSDRQAVLGGVSNDPFTVHSYNSTNELVKLVAGSEYPSTEPFSELYYPIFDDAEERVLTTANGEKNSTNKGTMVGVIGSWFYWRDMMKEILPTGINGVIAVFKNGCNQTFSYEINGPDVAFKGFYDAHDTQFNYLGLDSSLIDLKEYAPGINGYTGLPLTDKLCPYRVSLFPSKVFESRYVSGEPWIYVAVTVAIFLFTTAVFVLYDYLVERRQQKVLSTAVKSSAIVSSLFPSNVRARLYGLEEGQNESSTAASQRHRLKNYMNDKSTAKSKEQGGSLVDRSISTGRPIADLFPHATVLFGDIAGFTAWSSTREPSQVFILLESLYGMFDKLAARRSVFKVETIGDCYVAVAGLPDPRPDHASVMAKFARDCSIHMVELVAKMALTLGPDTEDLSMRFGLNSGPVTAGVLRGQKSRFQLFGDTVNTASRMETTGRTNCIHASESTANELRRLNKGHWLHARKDRVEVKGKGHMMTYWVDPSDGTGRAEEYANNEQDEDTTEVSSQPDLGLGDKEQRLINWNTDVLARLLRAIIARRAAFDESASERHLATTTPRQVDEGAGNVIDEVKEIIELPEFNPTQLSEDPDSIYLDPLVLSQLRDFVAAIAETYNGSSNPFHNFAHASHVCMSVAKLMSRIVAADDFFDRDTEAESLELFKHRRTFGITSDPLTLFACAFAALIHDTDHPGVPNTQLVKEGTDLAARYRNRSVAEQHSVDVAWYLLMEERYDNLRNMICPTNKDLQRFRQLVVNSVMATDIMDKDLKTLRNERWDKAFEIKNGAVNESVRDAMNRKATIVIEHLIQASDVAHTMQHWHVYRKWNERLFEELLDAYRAGRAEKDPSEFWYKGELGFFDFYILPLAKKLSECGVFGVSSDEYLNYAIRNREEWELKGEAIVEEMVEKFALEN